MATTTKRWYLSKTMWAGIITVLVAGYNAASGQFGLPAVPEFVYAMLGALGLYGRAVSSTKVTM